MKISKYLAFLFLFMPLLNATDIDEMEEVVLPDTESSRFYGNTLNNSYYLGFGIGGMNIGTGTGISSSFMLGYKLNDFLGFELRYSRLNEDVNGGKDTFKNLAIYAKQMLPLDTIIKPYSLLGYGKTFYNGDSDLQMQWGLGMDYVYTEQVNFFFDFESKYDGDFESIYNENIKLKSYMIGASYVF